VCVSSLQFGKYVDISSRNTVLVYNVHIFCQKCPLTRFAASHLCHSVNIRPCIRSVYGFCTWIIGIFRFCNTILLLVFKMNPWQNIFNQFSKLWKIQSFVCPIDNWFSICECLLFFVFVIMQLTFDSCSCYTFGHNESLVKMEFSTLNFASDVLGSKIQFTKKTFFDSRSFW
jgi:hypothetical protein